MGNLLQRALGGRAEQRSIGTVSDYLEALQSQQAYGFGVGSPVQQTLAGEPAERITANLEGLATNVYGRNSVIFACMLVRQMTFAGVRFQYQRLNKGRPSELFGTPELGMLEEPWQGATTGDLLARMITDADLAGNSYWTVHGGELVRLRPDWVDIVMESRVVGRGRNDELQVLGSRRVGYLYYEGGYRQTTEPVPLTVNDVAHFAPLPDPLATYRGMSWLSPLMREVTGDDLMTRHKQKFLEHGATPNLIIKHGDTVKPEQARAFKEALDEEYAGVDNAYKTMHVGGGADATVVGADFKQIDFQVVQSHGETRIAAAAGVPSIIVGLSKGLESATYSNYSQARRRYADGTLHPLWGNAAGSLQRIRPAPVGARLWYDTRDVPFLREDSKDAAEIASTQAQTMRTLIDAGYTAESVQRAVMSGDFGLLEHSGLFSVQLQKPGAQDAPAPAATPPSS